MIDASLFHALCRNDVFTMATWPSFESWDDYKYIIFLMHAYNRILYYIISGKLISSPNINNVAMSLYDILYNFCTL